MNDDIMKKLKETGKSAGLGDDTLNDSAQMKKADELLSKLSPAQLAKFSTMLDDKESIQRMMSTPQAQMLLKKFLENK